MMISLLFPINRKLKRRSKNTFMTIETFIEKFDNENSIILLEGKRNVLEIDKVKLTELGKLLAMATKNISFRSGNADYT